MSQYGNITETGRYGHAVSGIVPQGVNSHLSLLGYRYGGITYYVNMPLYLVGYFSTMVVTLVHVWWHGLDYT